MQLTSLQALTNLSVLSDYHTPYTQIIQHLYECLDYGSPQIQQQALKVLVNLSSNVDMVPHLLAAKVSYCIHCKLVLIKFQGESNSCFTLLFSSLVKFEYF